MNSVMYKCDYCLKKKETHKNPICYILFEKSSKQVKGKAYTENHIIIAYTCQ